MKKFAFSLLFALFATLSFAQVGPTGSFVVYPTGSDPCQNPSIAKATAKVAISTATTTELVAAVAGKAVYLCAFESTVAGTSPTILFLTGTKVSTACDTSPVNLSGVFAITSGSIFPIHPTMTATQSAASGELCLTSGGTTPSIQGFFTYVQQ